MQGQNSSRVVAIVELAEPVAGYPALRPNQPVLASQETRDAEEHVTANSFIQMRADWNGVPTGQP
jgi:hypothetical protein